MDFWRKLWFFPVLIALSGMLAYANGLRNGFTFDDWPLVVHNPLVQRLTPGAIFASSYWPNQPEYGLYRPLTTLSYAVNRAVLGEGAPGFRAVNVVLHIANALLVFAIACTLLGRPGAGLCGLVFLLHPIQTEAVNGIVGRAELLAGFWVLAGLVTHIYCRGWGRWVFPAVALFLGCLSKEHAVALFGILIACDVLKGVNGGQPAIGDGVASPMKRGKRDMIGRYALFAGVIGVFLGLRYAVIGAVLLPAAPAWIDNPLAYVNGFERVWTAVAVVAKYAGLLLWPGALSADYSFAAIPIATSMMDGWAVLGWAVAVLVLGVLWLSLCGRLPMIYGVGAAVIAIPFVPVSNVLFPVGTAMAERLMYVPVAGFALILGGVFQWGSEHWRGLVIGLVVTLLAGYGWRTVLRNADWKSDLMLFAAAVRAQPQSAKAHFNLGNAVRDAGDAQAALPHYDRALAIYPGYAEAHYNAGVIYQDQQRDAEALMAYWRAVAADSLHANGWNNLGVLQAQAGEYEAVADAFERVVRLRPQRRDARFNLALAYERLGRDAAGVYEALLRDDPGDAEAALNLSRLHRERGDLEEARRVLRQALAENPDALHLTLNLGLILEQQGDLQGAVAAFEQAVRLDDRWGAMALFASGRVYAQMGRISEAQAALRAFLQRDQGGDALRQQAEELLQRLDRER